MATAQQIPVSAAEIKPDVTAELATERAKWVVVSNSRILVGLVFAMSLFSIFAAACFALIGLDALLPFASITFFRILAAVQWVGSGLCFGVSCPFFWKLGRRMSRNEARLDSRGVDFSFGTKKAPVELFIPWEQIDSIQSSRTSSNRFYKVTATDGSEATFNSYTFFRAGKLAKLIAARSGRPIQKV